MGKKVTDEQPRIYFNCSKCPAYCCSIYERVQVTKRDVNRLAKYFGVTSAVAEKRYTKIDRASGERVLRRTKDVIFEQTCMFLDQETRGCTIYHGRPAVCREYPARARCSYYDLLQFERNQQDDPSVVPLVQITFREVKKKVVHDENGSGKAGMRDERREGRRQKAQGRKQKAVKAKALCLVCLLLSAFCLLFHFIPHPCF